MTYVINEDLCTQKGMKVEELLLVILLKNKVNLKETIDEMLRKEILVKDLFSGDDSYMITQRWNTVAEDILLSADTTIPTVQELEVLAVEMAHLFPQGLKQGTNIYWRGNKKDNVQKLQKFFKMYGQYTPREVLEATKKYIEKNQNNLTTMRVLKYFILKDNESDLATILENMHQQDTPLESQLQIDWETELR